MAKDTRFSKGAALGAGLTAAIVIATGAGWTAARSLPQASAVVTPGGGAVPVATPGQPFSFANLVQRVAPAVVSIDVTERPSGQMSDDGGQGAQGFPFDLFGQGGQGGQGGMQMQAEPVQATASGFFISPDGYIVTNNHVAGDASSITVRLADGRALKARLIGRDKATDLAVIKVEGHGFTYVNFEDKARPRVGDWVVAIGNPYDLGGTATAGIVSAYNRNIGQQFVDYMQIDAPINKGNSGGPTFDVDGRVVGVNTAIFSEGGGSNGIGFAVPASLAERVTHELITSGKVTRGYLGATVQNVTTDIAQSLGRPGLRGALIADLVPGGPAADAGLKPGDVVTGVDGVSVVTADALTRQVAQAHVGQVLTLRALRDGRPLNVQVRSGLRPSEDQLAKLDQTPSSGDQGDDQSGGE